MLQQPNRHRKQMSIGGPPKAILGGPQRKLSPLPPATSPSTQKSRKVIVNLPKETIPSEEQGQPATRPDWARTPLTNHDHREPFVPPVESVSRDIYPPDVWRCLIPDTIDVFLPGQHAWDTIKQQVIEEKLEQLGVERGSGNNVPHIYAPHARAASISSPADPALLLFKLNKLQLQQQQEGLASPSFVSPQPPFNASPHFLANVHPPVNCSILPRGGISNRHAHTMSLAQPPSYQPSPFESALPPNHLPMTSYHTPLSPAPRPTLSMPPRSILSPASPSAGSFGSPQNVLTPPSLSAVHPWNRLDFIRGFGLETPEEVDEEQEDDKKLDNPTDQTIAKDDTMTETVGAEGDGNIEILVDEDGVTSVDAASVTETGAPSGLHSRHASKLSASLSVLSSHSHNVGNVTEDMDAVGEWTGSEDLGLDSDNESIGEWSNPSDEERARQKRADRRMRRRMSRQQLLDKPRRIPNFPKPPENTNAVSSAHHQHRLSNPQPHQIVLGAQNNEEEDIISNPSEEVRFQQDEEYLVAAAGNYYTSQSFSSRPPSLPQHSRDPSAGQYSVPDPAQAHSRTSSDTFGVQYQQQLQQQQQQPHAQHLPTLLSLPALNPFAKPFVFGTARQTQLSQQQQQLTAPPNAPLLSHSPLPSFGSSSAGGHASNSSITSVTNKPLNVSAPEFKPTGFTFRPPPGVPQMPTLQVPPGLGLGLGPSTDKAWIAGGGVSPGGLFSRPLPAIPTSSSLADETVATGVQEIRSQQGREKRQRRNSSNGDVANIAMFDEGDSMRSFRFPVNIESPKSIRGVRRSMSDASVRQRMMSSSSKDSEKERGRDVEPFTFTAFSTVSSLPAPHRDSYGGEEGEREMEVEDDVHRTQEESTFAEESTPKNAPREGELRSDKEVEEGEDENEAEEGEEDEEKDTSLFRARKRPPLPLDFKQPTLRKNTVPAGLFKALVNRDGFGMDERRRRTVRSRLSSHEIFEHDFRKPSMDDTDVPRISSKFGRGRFVTDPESKQGGLFGRRRLSADEDEDEEETDDNDDEAYEREKTEREGIVDDVFSVPRQQQQHTRRGSSLPDDLHDVDADGEEGGLVSSPGVQLTTREDMQVFEERLFELIEDRFGAINLTLKHRKDDVNNGEGAAELNSKTEVMIADMVSLFRAQLQENAARSLEDSQMDARGEMDFQLIKDIIEEGHKALANMLRKELKETSERQQQPNIKDLVVRVVEDVGSRTVSAIVETVADFSARQEATMSRVANAPARERDALVEKLVSALTPMMSSLRTDPIDYEFLTGQLAQAVKPHISQLIDLASDKRETAGLIVDRILPLLPPQSPSMDANALTLQLTAELRKVIAPFDAHEIKEQVADLVIERLDSRLSVRDKSFNADSIAAKVVDNVSGAVQEPVKAMMSTLDKTIKDQNSAARTQVDELGTKIIELPSKLAERFNDLASTQDKIMSKLEGPTPRSDLDENFKAMMASIEEIVCGHQVLKTGDEELMSLNKEILDKLLSLPDALLTASNVLSDTHSELVTSLESSRREVDELRKMNAEYQIQMTKARSAHGQVRVEKDALSEKLAAVDADRDLLRSQIKELQLAVSTQSTESTSLKLRNEELEEALAQALARLQTADVASTAGQQRVTDLKNANRDLMGEKQTLEAKVESLNMEIVYVNRDKDTATRTLEVLQKQNEELALQQSHWDCLRQASEKIDALTNLIGQADNEELKELRLYRDGAKVEHSTLQKRVKELENKVAISERAATTARQTLTQAQQRSSEWERRAKESEGQLELTQTKLEQAEQTQTQLEADLSLVKLQLEEREADDRLAQDREIKLREQITLLENKTARLQAEIEHTKTPKLPQAVPVTVAPSPFRASTNGISPRPDSRASMAYDMRSITPSQYQHLQPASQASSIGSGTPPSGSVWNSVHAPRQTYPTPSWSSYQEKRYPYLGPSTPRSEQHYYRPAVPSPTPSTVSLTPTQGEDGWWL
ncbi:hypothetical protein AX17_000812 [Amanita inopinata Kibby_2008]|nr:hypothetical protein AX17_000812 [Amanita inopinata Kibby_2008]